MKLSQWARANGVSHQSAVRCLHAEVLPVSARQLATGTILVDEAAGVAIYARVSSAGQRADLDRQVARLAAPLTARGIAPTKVSGDLVRDMTEVLTTFCARRYGRRSAKHRAELALTATSRDQAA